MDAVRPIRDEIEHRIRGLIDEIAPSPGMTARPDIRITSMRPEHADAVLKIYL